MKKIYIIAAILFGIVTSAHASNDALELKLNVNTGDSYELTSKMTASFSCEGIAPCKVEMSQVYNAIVDVAGVDEQQNYNLAYRLQASELTMNTDNGISVKCLSDETGVTTEVVGFSEEPIIKKVEQDSAQPVTLVVSPQWDVIAIEGVDFTQMQEMVFSLIPALSPEKLVQGQSFLSPYPKEAITLGYEWDKSFEVTIAEDTEVGQGTLHHLAMNFADHFTLQSREAGTATIVSKSDSFPRLTASATVDGVTYNLDFAISKEGWMKVNEQTGMTENSSFTLLIDGEAEMQGLTLPFKGKIEVSLETHAKTSA